MFDVGFSELMVIAVVALVVIGPERLPGLARTVGALLGRVQRYFNDVKAEVNRELQLEELRRMREQAEAQIHSLDAQIQQESKNIEAVLSDKELGVQHAALPANTESVQEGNKHGQ